MPSRSRSLPSMHSETGSTFAEQCCWRVREHRLPAICNPWFDFHMAEEHIDLECIGSSASKLLVCPLELATFSYQACL
eukprot:1160951-Pelagomonas_calceolata.AAC.4